MLPILIDVTLPALGRVVVPTYGATVAGLYLAGLAYMAWQAPRHGHSPLHVLRGGFWAIAAAFVGARLPGLFLGGAAVEGNGVLDSASRFISAGTWIQAGLAAGAAGVVVYVLSQRISVWLALDLLALYLPLAQAIGHLGCLAAGCCWGGPTDLPWAIVFPSADRSIAGTAPLGVPLHPVQLYEAAGSLVLWVGLLYLHPRQPRRGVVTGAYLIGAGTLRFLVELWRADARGTVAGGLLSAPQAMALVVISLGAGVLALSRRRGGMADA